MACKAVYLSFSEAHKYIEEGDILLFRGTGIVSWFLARAGGGVHTHVAMASWRGKPHASLLECVEFREWRGGRTVSLKTQVDDFPRRIDVFRPSSPVPVIQTSSDEDGFKFKYSPIKYVGRFATDRMRELTGLPYGWNRIFALARFHFPFIRWFSDPDLDDSTANVYPVCSTAVAEAVRTHFIDLVKLTSDKRTEPADIARSALLNYLFTLDI